MASSSSKVEIEKFDGSNDFGLWKMKMLAHLGNLGLDLALGKEFPESMDEEKKKEVLKKAYNTLILSLSDKVLREIVKCKSAAEVWLKLESLYMTKNLSSRLHLKANFFTWKMTEGKDLQGHIDDFNKLVMDLENIGVEYEDEDKALVLLYSLPRSYETLVDILQHGRDTISLEDVVSALKAKEQKWKSDVGEQTGYGLFVRGRPSKKEKKEKARSKSRGGRKTIRCFVCHEEGHIKKDCPKRKKDVKIQEGGEAAIVECDDGYETADVLVASTSHSDKWIMDSGCSYHMTSNGGWFEDYKEINGGQVLLGNNSPCKVIGIGSVRIKTNDGFERVLPDVRHVLELKRNLISLGMLDQHGFSWKGEKGFLKVSKGSLVMMKGVKDTLQ